MPNFMDEPTAGLDVVAREEILDLLREYMEIPGRSIVISSHISGDLEHFCDDLYMIHEAKSSFTKKRTVFLRNMDSSRYQSRNTKPLTKNIFCV